MSLPIRHYDQFEQRHNGSSDSDLQKMLSVVGVSNIEELISQTIPADIRLNKTMNLPAALSEFELLKELKTTASRNKVFKSYIGMGYYGTATPGVILRNIMENPGWYTAYTPYQAEIAQGRLEALLNFQTMVIDLTGMEIANASMLDEGTSAAEGMHICWDLKKDENGNKFFVDERVFPQTIDILKTRAPHLGIELVIGDYNSVGINHDFFGAILQYPDANGEIRDYRTFTNHAHNLGLKVVAACDLLSLTMLASPGEWGADVAVGSSQRLGVPMGYGGPHAAFLATKDEYKRSMPGRIIGMSIDANGNPALRMALQTREQHIRREKATSNICTAQVLLAVMAGMYAVYHGPKGLKAIAEKTHAQAQLLAISLEKLGCKMLNDQFFDTLKIQNPHANSLKEIAEENEVNFRYFENGDIGISLDETTTLGDLDLIISIFSQSMGKAPVDINKNADINLNWDHIHVRTTPYLTHKVFNNFHTEHEMLRYIKRLENKDLSMVHSMISLGSCTMKLNATTEMIPVTWPEFGGLHPFAPINQTLGYQQIFAELESYLSEITGFAGTSLQPNAGAQGEYAGILVIKAYLKSIGQGHRDIALIPQSAHGTNPASAVMAGLKVVVVKSDALGNIDVQDLKEKAELHKGNLACLMVTYPSTHGVFEDAIREITQTIHACGGQVYMDGANMNAQVGLTSPGLIGADVCHLNLHKTFCIPHGGGGPGMGPICVAKHLVPFLPGHAVVDLDGDKRIHAVSAAPWGSASILLISYAYIRLMGPDGLANATRWAILNANYIASRLDGHYPILYKNKNGRAAHEMIVDVRSFKNTNGVEAEDIAKRLMDYGYHAPTLSFPVANTLMIEPTESETKFELDKFIDSLIQIRKEIAEIESGESDKKDNVLKNAPHTSTEATANEWLHSYSREKAVYPTSWLKDYKFWPTVKRVNSTYGDRNLICSCPTTEEYMEVATS